MRRIDRPADKKADVRGFLKQQPRDERRAVLPGRPFAKERVIPEVILRVFQHAIDRDDPFRYKVDALDGRDGRNFRVREIKAGNQRLVQGARDGGTGRAAADDVFACLGKKQGNHPRLIVAFARRAEHQVHRHALSDAHGHDGRIIAGLAPVETLAFGQKHGGERLGRVARALLRFQKRDDVLALPPEIERHANPRVNAAVAHEDEQVVLPERDDGAADLFIADDRLFACIFLVYAVAQENGAGIVVLDQFGGFVVFQVQNRERRVGDPAFFAHGQRRRDGAHTFGQGKPRRHHGGDDPRRQGGQDACLDAAAQPVRQHQHGAVLRVHPVDVVAAQLLALLVQALIADVCAQVIHG